MKVWEEFFSKKLAERKQENSLRVRTIHNIVDVDFYSNDYLNLGKNGRGSGGSPLIAGYSKELAELEKKIAVFHDAAAALVFSSGYSANVGLFSALGGRDTLIIYDELIHASIRDGIRLSFADSFSFRHNDLKHLQEVLNRKKSLKVIVVVEALYSMDGDLAPLDEVFCLCKEYGAGMIVDEAHSAGLYGLQGRGKVHEVGMQNEVLARVITFGKSIGSHGAAVVGSELLQEFLINFSRSYIYSTAIPPVHAVEISEQYQKVEQSEDERRRLFELSDFFDVLATENKLDLIAGGSPIKAILIPERMEVKAIAEKLMVNGISAKAILSPTVPEGKERLRISLHAENTKEQIEELIKMLR